VLVAKEFEANTADYPAACPLRIEGHGTREARVLFTQPPEYLMICIRRTYQMINTRVVGTEWLDLNSICTSSGTAANLDAYYEL
jgi:hypothetical protein